MIELMFLKELMLIKQANQNNLIFVNIGFFQVKVLTFNQIFVIDFVIYK